METNAHSNAALLIADDSRPSRKFSTVAHEAIEQTAEAAHHAIDSVGPAANRWITALRRRTAEYPLAALGIAIFAGFILAHIF